MKECELQQNKMETEQIFWRLNLPLEGHIPRTKMPQFVFNFPRRFYCQFKFAQCVETLLIFRLGPPSRASSETRAARREGSRDLANLVVSLPAPRDERRGLSATFKFHVVAK